MREAHADLYKDRPVNQPDQKALVRALVLALLFQGQPSMLHILFKWLGGCARLRDPARTFAQDRLEKSAHCPSTLHLFQIPYPIHLLFLFAI